MTAGAAAYGIASLFFKKVRASSLRDCRPAGYPCRGRPCSSRRSPRPCVRPARRCAIPVRAASRSTLDAGCRFFEQIRDGFGFFDGNRSDQHRLATLVELADSVRERVLFLQDSVDDGFEFLPFGAVDYVGIFDTDQRPVGRNNDDFEIINLAEFVASVSAVPVMPESFLYMRK